jgi:hypothetical protein
MKSLLFTILVLCTISDFKLSAAFVTQKLSKHHSSSNLVSLSATPDDRETTIVKKEDKFSFKQRIESIKTAAVGALSVCFPVVSSMSYYVTHDVATFSYTASSYFQLLPLGRNSCYTIHRTP